MSVSHHTSLIKTPAADMLAEALRAARAGFAVLPVYPHDKSPATGRGGYKNATTKELTITGWWTENPDYMIGVRTGEKSGVVALDLDIETDPLTGEVTKDGNAILQEVMRRNKLTLPDTVEARTPRGGRHLYFRHEKGFRCHASPELGIDCRGEGGYIVFPPSRRADGKAYVFENPPNLFEFATAPDWLADYFRTGKLPGLPAEKATVEAHAAPTGKALPPPYEHPPETDSGTRREDVERALAGYWNPDSYRDWYEAAMCLHDFANGLQIWLAWASRSQKFNKQENLRKWTQTVPKRGKTVRSIVGRVDRTTLSDWGREHAAEKRRHASQAGGLVHGSTKVQAPPIWDPWRETSAPPFPLDVVPQDVAKYVEARGIETGACRSAIAMSCLAAASGALSHEAKIYLKPGQNFPVSPRLWVLNVGDPSAKKTPAMDGAVKPLVTRQRLEHAKAMAEWREKVEAAEDKRKSKIPKPDLTHYVIHDTTPEMLAEVLSHQDRGTLLVADELAGWLGALDRYGSGKGASSGRAIWLQAYSGGPFSLLRVTRETLPVNNLSVSILGGIQPERLREIGGLTSDGLLQRFLPVMMAKPQIDRDVFRSDAFQAWDSRLCSLFSFSRFGAELGEEALKERQRISEFVFNLGQTDSEGSGWKGFVGKLLGVWGSLVLLLHVLWGYRAADPVSPKTAKRASILLENFILPHGLAFYRSLVGSGQSDSRAIAGFLAGWGETTISVRDFGRGPRCCRGQSPEEIAARMAPFETGGWLDPEKPGPWNRKWTITPGLADRFAGELARHKAAIAEIQAKISGDHDDE